MSTKPQNENSKAVEGEIFDPTASSATQSNLQRVDMSKMGGAGVDVQVATAKQYPRSVGEFKQRALAMATLDEETAALCIYAIPRGGKVIEGPSARLAEIIASAWGNLRIDARTTGEDARFVHAESVAWDLETNVAICYSTRRRITNRYGKRYDDDMIAVTANAATSIALRNSVFKVVPMAYTKEIYRAARSTAAGDIKTLALRRSEMLGYFARFGITQDRVLYTLGKERVEDIDLDDLATLKGVATAIKDGETQIDDAFPEIGTEKPEDARPKTDRLADRIAANAKQQVDDNDSESVEDEAETLVEDVPEEQPKSQRQPARHKPKAKAESCPF